MGHDFDTSRASYSVVAAVERLLDAILSTNAETLGDETADGVAAAQWAHARRGLREGYGDASSHELAQEIWGLA